MLANYGYKDGSGDWFITIDTGKCDGCGKCAEACPEGVFEVIIDDYDDQVAAAKEDHRKNIKYVCGPCGASRPCQAACPKAALTFSW